MVNELWALRGGTLMPGVLHRWTGLSGIDRWDPPLAELDPNDLPLITPGLLFWMDNAVLEDPAGTPLGTWLDRSPAARHAQQPALVSRPLIADVDAIKVATFDGGSDFMAIPHEAALNPNEFTIIIRADIINVGDYGALFGKNTNGAWGDGYGIYREGGQFKAYINAWDGPGRVVRPYVSGLRTITFRVSATQTKLRVDGAETVVDYAGGLTNPSSAPWRLAKMEDAYYSNVRGYDYMMFGRALSDSEVDELELFLA